MNGVTQNEMSANIAGLPMSQIQIEGLTEEDISDIINSNERIPFEDLEKIMEDEIHPSFGN